jgi:hypothetical protein
MAPTHHTRDEKDDLGSDRDLSVLKILPSYIGNSYSLLIYLMGYETLYDIAKIPEKAFSTIPGIGPARLRNISRALEANGLSFRRSVGVPIRHSTFSLH